MTIREKILVIEDEKSISHFISTVLNNNGYEAMQAQTGEEALSMISSHCPDLVILDLGLPDMVWTSSAACAAGPACRWWWSPPAPMSGTRSPHWIWGRMII